MKQVKCVEFKVNDNPLINEIMGQRGELITTAEVTKIEDGNKSHSVNYDFIWKSSFTEEESNINEEDELAIIMALASAGVSAEELFKLSEGVMHVLLEDVQYLLFVSNVMGGHTNTIHPDIDSLLAALKMFFRDSEHSFKMDEVRKLEMNENLWYEHPDSSWFTITKVPSKGTTDVKKAHPSNMEVFLTFSTDEWQTKKSYNLEGVSSTLEEARRVVERIFDEYGCNTKAVIKAGNVDFQDFSDVEVYDYDSGLEWKTNDSSIENSDVDYGYLAQSLEEEGEDD